MIISVLQNFIDFYNKHKNIQLNPNTVKIVFIVGNSNPEHEYMNNLSLEGYYSYHFVHGQWERHGVSIFMRDGVHWEKDVNTHTLIPKLKYAQLGLQ